MIKIPSSHRFLVIYSGCLTIMFAVTILCGFSELQKMKRFDEITVHRINIVEPDGTIRMVLTNKDAAPGVYIKNKEYAHETRHTAGLLFFDDEGTEDGGLIYGLTKDHNGHVTESNVHLSFDKYMQDQIFTIEAGKDENKDFSELTMQDRGDYSILAQMKKILPGLRRKQPGTQLSYLGRRVELTTSLSRASREFRDRPLVRLAK